MYEPLYSHSRGLAGFSCLAPALRMRDLGPDAPGEPDEVATWCGKFCRTERGMLAHLKSKHGLEPQADLPLAQRY